jgi:hypothetical protein
MTHEDFRLEGEHRDVVEGSHAGIGKGTALKPCYLVIFAEKCGGESGGTPCPG